MIVTFCLQETKTRHIWWRWTTQTLAIIWHDIVYSVNWPQGLSRYICHLQDIYHHHYTNLTFVRPHVRACVRESGRSREAIWPVLKKLSILRIARVERYTKEPTDTTRNATSPGLKETLCNSAGQKFDREVSLRVAAWRWRTSAIRESRLITDAWKRELILF